MEEKYNKKVSVIIPVYNAETYLAECLDSVLVQTLSEIEIICVDDGSTDNSLNILSEYKNKDSRIKILTQHNQYAGVARNNGMKIATGQYYVFWDADDYFEKNALEAMYKKISETKSDICLCGADRFDIRDKSTTKMTWVLKTALIPKKIFFTASELENIFSITSPAPWSKMFSADFVKKHSLKFQNTKRINDMYFVYSALALASKITVTEDTLIHYRYGQQENLQSTISEDPAVCCEALLALKETVDTCDERIQKSFYDLCINNILHNYNLCKENATAASKLLNEVDDYYMDALGIVNNCDKFLKDSKQYHELTKLIDNNNKVNIDKPIVNKTEEYIKPARRYEGNKIRPKVSIVIPIYNTEKYLVDCLNSVINQTFKNIEIICINDGSTDNSLAIIENYYLNDDRISVISQKNKGLSLARNVGINHASGTYIQFLDSDDYLLPDAIENLYTYAENKKFDIVFFGAKTLYEKEDMKKNYSNMERYYYVDSTMEKQYTGIDFFKELIQKNCFIPSANLQFYNREFIIRNNLLFYPGIYHEDNLFTFLELFYAKKVSRLGMGLYCRRIREQSITTMKKTFKHFYGYFKCYILMQSFVEQHDPLKLLPQEIYSFIERIKKSTIRHHSELSEDELKQIDYMTSYDAMWYNNMFLDKYNNNTLKTDDCNNSDRILTIKLINPYHIIKASLKEMHMHYKRYGFLATFRQVIEVLKYKKKIVLDKDEGLLISISVKNLKNN